MYSGGKMKGKVETGFAKFNSKVIKFSLAYRNHFPQD